MTLSVGIVLAALGITTLEMVEASAVGLTLYHTSKRISVYGAVAAGSVAVLLPTFLLGRAISFLPVFDVRIIAALLLLYFGIRLARSARRAVIRSKAGSFQTEEESHRSLMLAGFSVGAVEAFEAAIVLVALIPISLESAALGFILGIFVVLISTLMLHSQVRKVKQAGMKVAVSALLLAFSAFWGAESFLQINDIILIPLFLVFVLAVYSYSHFRIASSTTQG
ncbi:MAG: hypothetical protein QXX17_05625 [Conexivisphaerales archaeon]